MDLNFPILTANISYRNTVHRIMSLIMPHYSRWQNLILNVSNVHCMALVLDELATCPPPPLLERLVLVQSWDHLLSPASGPWPRMEQALFQGSAPRLLSSMTWNRMYLDVAMSTALFSGLRHLVIGTLDVSIAPRNCDIISMLIGTPALETLKLVDIDLAGAVVEGQDAMYGLPSTTLPPVLPRLHILVLTAIPAVLATALVTRLSLPTLLHLEINDIEDDEVLDDFVLALTTRAQLFQNPFNKIVRRDSPPNILCSLSSFRIMKFPLLDTEDQILAECLTNVQTLEIDIRDSERWYRLLLKMSPVDGPTTPPQRRKSTLR